MSVNGAQGNECNAIVCTSLGHCHQKGKLSFSDGSTTKCCHDLRESWSDNNRSQRTSLTRNTNNARRPFVQHYTRVSVLKKCTMDVKHLASTAHMRTKTKSPIHQRNIKSRQVSTTPLCAFTVEAFGKPLADERRWPKTRLKGKRHCRLRELLNRTKHFCDAPRDHASDAENDAYLVCSPVVGTSERGGNGEIE